MLVRYTAILQRAMARYQAKHFHKCAVAWSLRVLASEVGTIRDKRIVKKRSADW